MPHHFATIKDIARVLGISPSTVSRAMRDTYDVSQKTKDDVLRVASELNYKPNYNATALAKGKTHNIGILLPFITNYYFSSVISAVQEIAQSKGFNLVLFITNDSPEAELSIVRNLYVTGLDGLLVCIATNSKSIPLFQKIIDEGTPIVFFDRVTESIKTSKVVQDDFNGAMQAVQHLVEQGYTRIAHMAGPPSLLSQRRLDGYLEALSRYNLARREEWIIPSGFAQEEGEADTEKLLQCEVRPDAIFSVNDRKAIGAILTLKRRQIPIGKTIGVMGFTNDPMSAIISPSLTTIEEPALAVGKEAGTLLFKHIQKKHFTPEEKIFSGRLIVRESTTR